MTSWFRMKSTNYVNLGLTLANQPELHINKTHVRHKYLLNNQTDHEIQLVQLEYPNSVEKIVKPGSIKPVHFSPDDASNRQ